MTSALNERLPNSFEITRYLALANRFKQCTERVDGTRKKHDKCKLVITQFSQFKTELEKKYELNLKAGLAKIQFFNNLHQLAFGDQKEPNCFDLDKTNERPAKAFNKKMMDSVLKGNLANLLTYLKSSKVKIDLDASSDDRLSQSEKSAKNLATSVATVFHELYRNNIFTDELEVDTVINRKDKSQSVRICSKKSNNFVIIVTPFTVKINDYSPINLAADTFEDKFSALITANSADDEVIKDNIIRSMLHYALDQQIRFPSRTILPNAKTITNPKFVEGLSWAEINQRYGIDAIASEYGIKTGCSVLGNSLQLEIDKFNLDSNYVPSKIESKTQRQKLLQIKPNLKGMTHEELAKLVMTCMLQWALDHYNRTGLWQLPSFNCKDFVPELGLTWRSYATAAHRKSHPCYGLTLKAMREMFGFKELSGEEEEEVALIAESFRRSRTLPPISPLYSPAQK